jgi:hypothetical protein
MSEMDHVVAAIAPDPGPGGGHGTLLQVHSVSLTNGTILAPHQHL